MLADTTLVVPWWSIAPFVILLLCIALGPIAFPKVWHERYPFIAAALALVTATYNLLHGQSGPLLHAMEEYIGFISFISSLYIVSGGVHITVKGEATPVANAIFLIIGAVLANIIGTTGASMLLIRPWIRMNRYRITSFHIIFFIFIVSNVGGCLTPVGDPPLFVGYLKGVPFWWVLTHCWEAWFVIVLTLAAVFLAIDYRNYLRAPKEIREMETAQGDWKFQGLHNLVFLAFILAAVLFLPTVWREAAMAASAIASWFTTRQSIHRANEFSFAPIKEVAWLFIGIFITMGPAVAFLQHSPPPMNSELAFYWATGALSGMLDNAPTYVAFLATALGRHHLDIDNRAEVASFAHHFPGALEAISMGSVFFGAMTYIGNGPNFMVKAIADHSRIRMPGFIGYVARYSVPILLPLLALVGILFFSKWRVFG